MTISDQYITKDGRIVNASNWDQYNEIVIEFDDGESIFTHTYESDAVRNREFKTINTILHALLDVYEEETPINGSAQKILDICRAAGVRDDELIANLLAVVDEEAAKEYIDGLDKLTEE